MYKIENIKPYYKKEEIKMKKLWLVGLIILVFTVGCASLGNTPTARVEELLRRYQNHSDPVLIELGDFLDSLDLDLDVRDDYHAIYLRQYQDMEFEVQNETIEGDRAVVTVLVRVYDYYRANIEINNFIASNPNEFLDEEGNFSQALAFRHRIDELSRVTNRVEHTIDFVLTRADEEWRIDTLTIDILEKLHGTFPY